MLSKVYPLARRFVTAMSGVKVILGTGEIGRGTLLEDGPVSLRHL